MTRIQKRRGIQKEVITYFFASSPLITTSQAYQLCRACEYAGRQGPTAFSESINKVCRVIDLDPDTLDLLLNVPYYIE